MFYAKLKWFFFPTPSRIELLWCSSVRSQAGPTGCHMWSLIRCIWQRGKFGCGSAKPHLENDSQLCLADWREKHLILDKILSLSSDNPGMLLKSLDVFPWCYSLKRKVYLNVSGVSENILFEGLIFIKCPYFVIILASILKRAHLAWCVRLPAETTCPNGTFLQKEQRFCLTNIH